MIVAVLVYVAGALWAARRYGKRTDTRTSGAVWGLGLMVVLWPVMALGEVSAWRGRGG